MRDPRRQTSADLVVVVVVVVVVIIIIIIILSCLRIFLIVLFYLHQNFSLRRVVFLLKYFQTHE